MKQFISFDIGGTDIKYGIIDEHYHIIEHHKFPTNAKDGGPSIINRIIEKILIYKEKYNLHGVAVSSAGVIDPFKGEVVAATGTIPNYVGVNIKKMIEEKTQLKCEVLNDVKCFALCEQKLGNGKDAKDFIMLTVGTGIGGAICINNELIYGKDFSAGEWGRMIINNHVFEEVASITGLISFANIHMGNNNWDGKKIFDLYDQDDEKAKYVVDLFYDHLSTGIINLMYVFNPEKVIIGGGITARNEKFKCELQEYINKQIDADLNTSELMLSKYSNHSGMLGALIHFHNMHKK